jgi:hypothetical protein
MNDEARNEKRKAKSKGRAGDHACGVFWFKEETYQSEAGDGQGLEKLPHDETNNFGNAGESYHGSRPVKGGA